MHKTMIKENHAKENNTQNPEAFTGKCSVARQICLLKSSQNCCKTSTRELAFKYIIG